MAGRTNGRFRNGKSLAGEAKGGAMRRKRVFFGGRVQGVGFRFNTAAVARSFDVTGYVRNLPDGRVELVAEGESAELDRFIQSVRERMQDFIRDVKIDSTDANGQFDSFEIRY